MRATSLSTSSMFGAAAFWKVEEVHTFRSVCIVLAGVALVSGCGGESEDGPTPAEALFAASGTATPDSVFGVWAGRTIVDDNGTLDYRIRFSETSAEVAAKCTRLHAGETLYAYSTANARINASEIALFGGNTDVSVSGNFKCTATAMTKTTPVCEGGNRSDCFVLEGTTLTMYVTETKSDELTKVAD